MAHGWDDETRREDETHLEASARHAKDQAPAMVALVVFMIAILFFSSQCS